jgi:hypothetical protein
MRTLGIVGTAALIIALAVQAAIGPAPIGQAALGTPAASPFSCPVTQPNGVQAGANLSGPGTGNFGNDALWTDLWMWGKGVVQVPPDQVGPNGLLGGPSGLKWAWYRFVPGKLTIDGKRLDAPAPPLIATIPDGYGNGGFQVSGLAFPTGGCWQVTGHVAGKSLTFVVLVIPPGSATPVATP